MFEYSCRLYFRKYPLVGDIVAVRIKHTGDKGVTVSLLEYGNIEGLVPLSEIPRKRIGSIQKAVRAGNAEICSVLRVEGEKGYVDLSMSKVTENEKSTCIENCSRNMLAYNIMIRVAKKLGKPVSELYEEIGYSKEEEFGNLYFFFARVKDNESILQNDEIGLVIKESINEMFQASTYRVRADVDVTCATSNGVESIKKAFGEVSLLDPKLKLCLIKSPTYSVTRVSRNKDKAYSIVERACDVLKLNMKKEGGICVIVSNPKLYREKSRYNMLNFEENERESSEE